jgi:hypothetical protein
MKKLFAAISLALGLSTSASAMMTASDYCQNGQCVIYKEVVTKPATKAAGSDSQVIFLGKQANISATGVRSYNGDVCTFEAVVPVAVYRAVMSRFEEQASADELAPALDPATQTMILFYNSFMSQAKGANTCS